ncbi:MAG: hypothetical protein ACLP0A_11475 [Verrucomicrobiia bacterium]
MAMQKCDPSILKGLTLVGVGSGATCYAGDITPPEYLEYARQELRGNDSRSRINAFGHGKRAIHAHVDFLLHNCGRFLRKADFPIKLELLQRLGIVAPSILGKYNRLRNVIEHEYTAPSQEAAEEIVDVAELFLSATLRYTRPLPKTLTFLPHTGQGAVTVECDWDEKEIDVVSSIDNIGLCGRCVIGSGDGDLWLRWVAQILAVMQDVQNPYRRCKDIEKGDNVRMRVSLPRADAL